MVTNTNNPKGWSELVDVALFEPDRIFLVQFGRRQ